MKDFPTGLLVVAACLARADGHMLLRLRPPGKPHAGVWEFPGGKVEHGETPRAALIREIAEELGIAVFPNDLTPAGFADGSLPGAAGTLTLLLFATHRWDGTARGMDGAQIAWFDRTAAMALPLAPLDRRLLDERPPGVRPR